MTLFKKILDHEIPADIVFEDEDVCAFRDINPQAPVHVLVIPRKPIASLAEAGEDDQALLGRLMYKAARVAENLGLSDYRLVVNNGPGAGQSVFHLHLHILGGRSLSWPPG